MVMEYSILLFAMTAFGLLAMAVYEYFRED